MRLRANLDRIAAKFLCAFHWTKDIGFLNMVGAEAAINIEHHSYHEHGYSKSGV